MCIYIYIYIYIYTYIHTYIHIDIYVCVCVCVRVCTCLQVHTHTKSLLYWQYKSVIPACAIGYVNTLIISTSDYYDASIQLKENKYMPSKCYLFNQSNNAAEINAHYIQLIINNKIC